jgi:hypothetical protein
MTAYSPLAVPMDTDVHPGRSPADVFPDGTGADAIPSSPVKRSSTHVFRDIAVTLLLLGMSVYALYEHQQWAAIVGLVLLTIVTHEATAHRFIDTANALLGRTTSASFRELEVRMEARPFGAG